MSYFFSGLWHLAAAMSFAVSLGVIQNGDMTALLRRPEFVVPCLLSSSALFFIPDTLAKKGLMKFLHYPLPDWDVLLLGPASHRHWLTHSALLPALLFWFSLRYPLGQHGVWLMAASGLCVGLASHLFWDCVSSRTHKIVVLPYWISLKPAMSRVYLLAGAAASMLIASSFGSALRAQAPAQQISVRSVAVQTSATSSTTTSSLAPQLVVGGIEGPEAISVAPDGSLFAVSNTTGGALLRIENGQAVRWLETSTESAKGRPNGTKFWGKTLFLADSGRKQIWAIAPDKTVTVVTDAAKGDGVNGPNDLAFAPDGSFYFTDPKWDAIGNVYHTRRDAQGRWKTVFFASGFKFPNGIAVSRDGKAVYVAENQRNRIWKVERKPDGSAGNKRVWSDLPAVPRPWNGPDGIRLDDRGRLFVAQFGAGKIQVLNPDGRVLTTLEAGGANPTNVAFSRDYKTLYVTEGETKSIYKIDVTSLR